MDIYNKYIEIAYGYEIEDNKLKNSITALIGHYRDCNIDDNKILFLLLENGINLAEFKDTLTKKDTYYCHSQLRINSKSPIWHPERGQTTFPYYLEMKSLYTMNDLLSYYYSTTLIPAELRNFNKDAGSFKHLLDKYVFKRFDSLDVILTCIDITKDKELRVTKVFDLENVIQDAYELLQYLYCNNKNNQIVWREK